MVLSACTNSNVGSINYAKVYGSRSKTIQPNYVIYHHKADSSTIYFRINSNHILYARKDKSQPYQASITLHYEVFDIENRKIIIDSSSVEINDLVQEKVSKYLKGQIRIPLRKGKQFNIKLFATDKNRNNTNEQHIAVNKSNTYHKHFFLVRSKADNEILFDDFTTKTLDILVQTEENANQTVYALQYYRQFPIAAPPFANSSHKSFDYKPDVLTAINVDDKGFFNYTLRDSGFVHFTLDSTSKNGMTFFGYDQNFPSIKTIYGMIGPLRYISSNSEYEEVTSNDDTKKRVDEFWLTKAGNEDRAREIIKKYYNRVQDANAVFTSYHEGWKTDRGMISLIFGTPKSVRRNRDEEVWYYGEETNSFSLQFTFVKVDNPFTDNDYKLLRAPSYKTNWYRAVDAWRSGRVYWAQY